MVWGWLIAMTFIQCVAMSMAELCSSMPTSGGLYYASAVLAPPGYGPLAACMYLKTASTCMRIDGKIRVDRLVELAGTSHWRALRRLPPGGNDPCLRFHLQSWLRSSELAGLAADDIDLAYSWVYQ